MTGKWMSGILTASLIFSFFPTEAQAARTKTKLNRTSLTMTVGQKKTIKLKKAKKLLKKKLKKVKWKSTDKTVAKVTCSGKSRKKGVIRAKKAGTVTIKVKYNGKTYRCKVTVTDKSVKKSASMDPATQKSAVPSAAGNGLSSAAPSSSPGGVDDKPTGIQTDKPTGTQTDKPTGTQTDTPTGTQTGTPGSTAGDDSLKDYVEPANASYSGEDTDTSREGAVEIAIPETPPEEKIEADRYTISKKNKMTITASGTYVIRTEGVIDGLIEVDYADPSDTGLAHLVLDGVNMTSSVNSAPTSDKGLITIKKSVPKAVITLAENSVNILTDTGTTGIDEDDGKSTTYTAGIVSKKTPLTINGSGSLRITSANGNGIKCTDELKILDAAVAVGTENAPAGHNGITGKTGLFVRGADITVYSKGDALKTTWDETNAAGEDVPENPGNMVLDGGTYQISSDGGDAVSVYRTLLLNPESLTANARYTSSSRTDDTSSKAVKAGTTIYIPETAGTMELISARDDTLHCNAHIRIDGGTLAVTAGDDGVHSDTGLQINGGTIQVKQSYEGLESGDITITGGNIEIKSSDDGINAAGGNNSGNNGENPGGGFPGGFPGGGFRPGPGGDNFNPKDETANSSNYQIIIAGGCLTVDAGGDGIDSNGNIFFRGGIVTVNGPTNAGNGALDYGDVNCVCEISGGTLIAAGAQGMDVAPTSGSSQPAVNVRLSSTAQALTYVVLKDADGNTVMTARPTKTFQSVVMSCGEFSLGSSYTVYYGASPDSLTKGDTFTFSSVSVSTGSQTGGWNRPGGRW